MEPVRSLEDVRRSMASNTNPLLGLILFWALEEAQVSREHLERVWHAEDLDDSWLPEKPTPEKAFKAAARAAAVGVPDMLVRLARSDESTLAFGCVREEKDGLGHLRYSQEALITLDRATGRVHMDDPAHPVAQHLRATFDECLGQHSADEVRRTVGKVLEAAYAFNLRPSGGVVFVPAPKVGLVRKLERAVSQIGKSRLFVLPVHENAEAKRTLAEVAGTSIEQELATLKAELEAFTMEPPARTSTLAKRFEVYDDLRSKAQVFRSVLAVELQDLDQTLDSFSGQLEQLWVTCLGSSGHEFLENCLSCVVVSC